MGCCTVYTVTGFPDFHDWYQESAHVLHALVHKLKPPMRSLGRGLLGKSGLRGILQKTHFVGHDGQYWPLRLMIGISSWCNFFTAGKYVLVRQSQSKPNMITWPWSPARVTKGSISSDRKNCISSIRMTRVPCGHTVGRCSMA